MKCSVEDKLKAVLDIRTVVDWLRKGGDFEDCWEWAEGGGDEGGVLKDLADYIINQSKGDNAKNEVLGNDLFLD